MKGYLGIHGPTQNILRMFFSCRRPVRDSRQSVLVPQVLFLVLVVVTIGMVFTLAWLYSFLPPPESLPLELLIESARRFVSPEPTERFVFVVLAMGVPLLAFLSVTTRARTWVWKAVEKIPTQLDASSFAAFIIPTILLGLFFNSDFLSRILNGLKGVTIAEYALLPCMVIVCAAAAVSAKPSAYMKIRMQRVNLTALPPLAIGLLLLLPFTRSDFLAWILGMEGNAGVFNGASLLLFSIFSLSLCLWKTLDIQRKWSLNKGKANVYIWAFFIVCVLLQLFSWRLAAINTINVAFKWWGHADPLFYVLSQAVSGKTVLVDLPSQYGLWVEMIVPIFHFVPASVLNVTSLFAILQLTSLIALYFVLLRIVKEPLLLTLGGVALVVLTFGTNSLFSDIRDYYFQYWPIRSFWPMLSVFVFFKFSQHPTLQRCILVSVLGALSLFWNADTGLFIILAFGIFLIAKGIISTQNRVPTSRIGIAAWSKRQYVFAIATSVSTTILVLSVLFALLSIKSGEALNYSWLYEYQKIFFGLGFFMLPLPREIHPWMSILGVYLLGLLVSLHAWKVTPNNIRMDIVFYLSMLGLGLFSYYQGRSHILNLTSVCWPALLIGLILSDETIRAVRAGLLSKFQIFLPVSFVMISSVCCFAFLSNFEKMVFGVVNLIESRELIYAPLVMNELAFVKEHSVGRQTCLILSKRQGIYYAESGLSSPLKGPGLVETILKRDQDRLIEYVKKGRADCLYFGLGRHTDPGLPLDLQSLEINYAIAATNSEGTMVYLVPKPQ